MKNNQKKVFYLFVWWSISKKNIKIWLFQKLQKSQNKIEVAEEIGCRNDIIFIKIGRGNEMNC